MPMPVPMPTWPVPKPTPMPMLRTFAESRDRRCWSADDRPVRFFDVEDLLRRWPSVSIETPMESCNVV